MKKVKTRCSTFARVEEYTNQILMVKVVKGAVSNPLVGKTLSYQVAAFPLGEANEAAHSTRAAVPRWARWAGHGNVLEVLAKCRSC